MTWRPIEKELVDICRAEGLELRDADGEIVITQGDLVLISITELAKGLARRGIGQGTPQ